MNRFIVVGFEFCKSFYYSLVSCKAKSEGVEYKIFPTDDNIRKQLNNNNIIREINGCLQIELSANGVQDGIKTEIAKALGKITGKQIVVKGFQIDDRNGSPYAF